jgi:hypothetical protein
MVQRNYAQIKQDVRDIIDSEMQRMAADPKLALHIIQKNNGNYNDND